MALYDGAGDRLAGNLSLIVQNYEDERERYWSEVPAEASLIHFLDALAKALLNGSSDMLVDPAEPWEDLDSSWQRVVDAVHGQGYSTHLAESIELRIAEDMINRLFESPDRCLQLASHILAAQPAEAVRRYLARLGRCYIAGFLPECIILCRAVLENAVKETFDRRGGSPAPETMSMRKRLDHAEAKGWVTPQGRTNALTVWLRGNIAVHDDPEVTTDALGTVVLTMDVLRQLYDDS